MTAVAAIAAALAGCDAEQEGRGQDGLDREGSPSAAQRVADFGLEVLNGVVMGQIDGLIGGFIDGLFGGGDDVVTLSQESLDAIRDIVTEVVDAQAWETQDMTLSAISDFIGDYSRSICVQEPCDEYSELQLDEADVERYSEGLHKAWKFFASQGGVDKKLSGITQMVLISSLRMMLLHELVGLKKARGLCIAQVEKNLKDAACTYRTKLVDFEKDYQTRIGQYGEIFEENHKDNCWSSWGYGGCSYSKDVCFNSPRGKHCEEDTRATGSYLPPEAGQWDAELPGELEALRDEWKQEDFELILGADAFYDNLDELASLCNTPPTTTQADCN